MVQWTRYLSFGSIKCTECVEQLMAFQSASAAVRSSSECTPLYKIPLWAPRIPSTLPGLTSHPFCKVQDSTRRQLLCLQTNAVLLRPEIDLNNTSQLSYYLKENTICLHYKHTLRKNVTTRIAVCITLSGKYTNHCSFCENHRTCTHTYVYRMCG